MAFLFASLPPPTRQHAAHPITPAHALQKINDYLAATATSPHLHPDCRFNERGPTLEGRASGGGLILHQLGRVAEGLSGVRLVPEDQEQSLNGVDGIDSVQTDGGVREVDELERVPDSMQEDADVGDVRREGQDGIMQGELGARSNIVGNEGEVDVSRIQQQDSDRHNEKKAKKRKRAEDDEDGLEAGGEVLAEKKAKKSENVVGDDEIEESEDHSNPEEYAQKLKRETEEEEENYRKAQKRAKKRKKEERRRAASEAAAHEEKTRKCEKQAQKDGKREKQSQDSFTETPKHRKKDKKIKREREGLASS